MNESIFPWSIILNHLPKRNAVACRGIFGSNVMLTGSDPVDFDKFYDFLNDCGITVCSIDDIITAHCDEILKPEVLIIGQNNWSEDELYDIIEALSGSYLRVYSQEMFFASIALNADVFDILSEEELRDFGFGHPALEFLMNEMNFDWPTTVVDLNSNFLVVDFEGKGPWPENGVLTRMGYRVGYNKGLSEPERREILSQLFLKVKLILSDENNWDEFSYISEWGETGSSRRLEKMANCLASFARFKKKDTSRDNSKAIKDWETDLAWLKQNYYDTKFNFSWPDTWVGY
jgi:hypothetical protein